MLAMCLEEDAEIVGEERAAYFHETGEVLPSMFNGDLGAAEAQGFFNMLQLVNSVYAKVQ